MSDSPIERVALGAAIFALHDPHRGHERAFNRWYERDHMYALGIMAPWTMAAGRWVATAELKQLRTADEAPFGPLDAGSFLTMFWIQAGHLEDQQQWVAEESVAVNAAGRTFDERDVMTATTYDYRGATERDHDGVPPELALDRRYAGLVWAVLERHPSVGLDEFQTWLVDDHLPKLLAGTPVAMALLFSPRPKEPWWPAAAPEVPGVGDRLVVSCFVEADPRECWDDVFAGFGDSVRSGGRGRALLVAPFIPSIPGTDAHLDNLW
jgi:hypothetical protein